MWRDQDACVAVAFLPEADARQARDALLRLALTADIPASYQEHQAAQQAQRDVEKFATALDLVAQVNTPPKFLAAAMALCNGLATRFGCDRVSLGWLERHQIRLRAMSRTENFNRRMEAAQKLEVAMEEALDQDDEILWPAPAESTVVTRDHEAYATDQQISHLCSLPLRVKNKPVAVLTCERQQSPFTETALQQIRLCCDLVAPRLTDLKHRDRWFGARWAATAREYLATFVGPEHTWAKLLACTGALLLGVLFFLKLPYRVEGNFVLRSDQVAYMTAPFDGYIDEVHVRPGDLVTNGQPLLAFKTTELELQQSAALADLSRYLREAEKARAADALAEMRIAQAQADQARARLDALRYRLEQAVLRAPFDGYVVEGDWRDRLGAPVEQADVLFQIARTDRLYIEAEINERDIHELIGHSKGEMAFVSQPKLKFPIRITTLEQAAFPKDQENVFFVRCEAVNGPQLWWRPGMSGLTKFDIEPRPLIWIITHRTVDFLRMWLWW